MAPAKDEICRFCFEQVRAQIRQIPEVTELMGRSLAQANPISLPWDWYICLVNYYKNQPFMYVNIPYMDGIGMFSIVWLQATKIKVLVERLSVTTI